MMRTRAFVLLSTLLLIAACQADSVVVPHPPDRIALNKYEADVFDTSAAARLLKIPNIQGPLSAIQMIDLCEDGGYYECRAPENIEEVAADLDTIRTNCAPHACFGDPEFVDNQTLNLASLTARIVETTGADVIYFTGCPNVIEAALESTHGCWDCKYGCAIKPVCTGTKCVTVPFQPGSDCLSVQCLPGWEVWYKYDPGDPRKMPQCRRPSTLIQPPDPPGDRDPWLPWPPDTIY